MVTIIVAYDEKRVIGKDGKLPWCIREEMKHFVKTTVGHSVVMGRNTWDSIPRRPLRDRYNFIVSGHYARHPAEFRNSMKDGLCGTSSNVYLMSTLEKALEVASRKNRKTFIIGGERLYRSALEAGVVDCVLATEIPGDYEGDTYFPELDSTWSCFNSKNYGRFTVVDYRRLKNGDKDEGDEEGGT